MHVIRVDGIGKEYVVKSKFFLKKQKQNKRIVRAIDNVSFSIEQGEAVGLIGKNGSGKSTMIKILTGIITPTCGKVLVLGKDPFLWRNENTKRIGVIFGQKTQLWWELPAIDTFVLHRKIYEIPDAIYNKNMGEFEELLDLKDLLHVPSRQLSLGQRVKLDIALSLLHDPKIVFLDEPTIGLDIPTKQKIRTFLKEKNQKQGTTLFLTSHDMYDIENVCDRVIVLDAGKKVLDGDRCQISNVVDNMNTIEITYEKQPEALFLESLNREKNIQIKQKADSYTVRYDATRISNNDLMQLLMQGGMIASVKMKKHDITNIFDEQE